ncbi:MAG: peptidylprolyl isomerase [Planctomycetes bacterium]|nr:peptidylprolyl isomerase [Planctomycetota bacterium]
MSQTVPPRMQGQIEAPNPLELYWEKNKRWLIAGLVVVLAALGGRALLTKMEQWKRDEQWATFAAASGLDRDYTERAAMWSFVEMQLRPDTDPRTRQMIGYQYGQLARFELLQDLGDVVKAANAAELQQLSQGSDARAPLACWLLAVRAISEERFADAVKELDRLEKDFPDHLLCRGTEFPVQFRAEKDDDKDQKEREAEQPKRNGKDKTEYEPPVAGSPVSHLRAAIEAELAFRAEHAALYQLPEATSPETIVFVLGDGREIAVKLYADRAPTHAAKLLELAREGWWKGQRVHEIRRSAGDDPFLSQSAGEGEFRLGWKSTEDADPSKWTAGKIAEGDEIGWEDSGVSNFPGVLAVEAGIGDKSQVERLVFTSADVAGRWDGSRVVVGRIVSGLDVVESIVDSPFADEESQQRGFGRPQDEFLIKDVRVE